MRVRRSRKEKGETASAAEWRKYWVLAWHGKCRNSPNFKKKKKKKGFSRNRNRNRKSNFIFPQPTFTTQVNLLHVTVTRTPLRTHATGVNLLARLLVVLVPYTAQSSLSLVLRKKKT